MTKSEIENLTANINALAKYIKKKGHVLEVKELLIIANAASGLTQQCNEEAFQQTMLSGK